MMIEVKNVYKEYNLEDNQWIRILQQLGLKRIDERKIYKALSSVSFKIEHGETVGIIGNNGAGKSTLLQIVSGTLKASGGEIIRPKRIAALLELGAGFNPEFTGRENVYLNGALIGMTKKEINQKFNDILDFSGIGDFIHQPVKTYSSGMFARLAFAVAVHSKPDLLIVDEALSVGDTSFQEKSINKMKELKDSGVPIFFVSHSIPMVRNFCDRVIWLDKGLIQMDGEARIVCEHYLKHLKENQNGKNSLEMISHTPPDASIVIENYEIDNNIVSTLDDISLMLTLKSLKPVRTGFGVGLIISDENGQIISVMSTVRDEIDLENIPTQVSIKLKNIPYLPGNYNISISITDELSTFHYDRIDYCLQFEVIEQNNKKGLPLHEGISGVEHEWIF